MSSITVALDHSFLRRASEGKLEAEFASLKRLAESGKVQYVASVIHLFEIAKHPNRERNIEEAKLIDSLRPRWLKYRLDLIGEELLNLFHVWRGEPHFCRGIEPVVTSPSQQLSAGRIRIIEPDASSAEGIVSYLQSHPEQLEKLNKLEAFINYIATLKQLSEARSKGTAEFKKIREKGARDLVRALAPERDHSSNFTRASEREQFANEMDPWDCPTLATELTLFEYRVRRNFIPEASEAWDLQFATAAVPYITVTAFDRQFHNLVSQAARACKWIKSSFHPTVAEALAFIEQTVSPSSEARSQPAS